MFFRDGDGEGGGGGLTKFQKRSDWVCERPLSAFHPQQSTDQCAGVAATDGASDNIFVARAACSLPEWPSVRLGDYDGATRCAHCMCAFIFNDACRETARGGERVFLL